MTEFRVSIPAFTGGINQVASGLVRPGHLTAGQNIRLSPRGAVSKRAGTAKLNATQIAAAAISGLGAHWTLAGVSTIVAGCGTVLVKIASDGTVTNIKTGLVGGDWEFVNYLGNLYAFNGVDNPQKWTGSAIADLGGTPPNGNIICEFSNYLFVVQPAAQSTLQYSDYQNSATWPAYNTEPVPTDDGGGVIALANFQDGLVALKERSIHVMRGKIRDDFRWTQRRPDLKGTCARRSVMEVGGLLYYLARDGIRAFTGSDSRLISNRADKGIQDTIDSINWAQVSKACAGKKGRLYYLAVPTGASTVCDTVIIYDTEMDAFLVDKGMLPPSAFLLVPVSGVDTLYYGNGNAAGHVIQYETGTEDAS